MVYEQKFAAGCDLLIDSVTGAQVVISGNPDVVAALGSPAQAGEAANAAGSVVAAMGAGLPVYGPSALGADAYGAAILTAPARTCRNAHIAVGDNGALVSFDGGNTDHFAIPANTSRLLAGLAIPAGAVIKAKNLEAGLNYTKMYIAVW